jgi:triacylglycerol lipase
MRRFTLLATCLLAASCASESDVSPCEEATDLISSCYGEEAASSYQCDPETAGNIADKTCSELSDIESKSDLSLCSVLGIFCPADPIFADPQGTATQFPLVLAHGFNGSPENEWGVHPDIIAELRADGHEVYVARVAPFQSVSVRGQQLADEIDRALAEFGAEKVNIIAHSMGGLDSRFAISSLDYASKVSSLTTISTPHRGTQVADAALGLIPGKLDAGIDAVVSAFAGTFTTDELANDGELRAAFESLSEASLLEFNKTVLDADNVYYQSWAGLSNVARISGFGEKEACQQGGGEWHFSDDARDHMDARLVLGAALVAHGTALLPNDGMATVASAQWGDFRGCVPADHYDEVGQVGPQRATGFDAMNFYRTIAFELTVRRF